MKLGLFSLISALTFYWLQRQFVAIMVIGVCIEFLSRSSIRQVSMLRIHGIS